MKTQYTVNEFGIEVEAAPVYAVHLSDLSVAKQSAPLVIDLFLRPDFIPDHPCTVQVGKKGVVDGVALILDGVGAQDIERIEATVDLLLGSVGKRALGRPFRVYRRGPRGGWKKIRR